MNRQPFHGMPAQRLCFSRIASGIFMQGAGQGRLEQGKPVIRRLAKYLPSSSDLDGIEDDDLEPFATAAAPVQPVERDVTPAPAEDEPPRQRRIQAVTGGRREQAVEDVTPQIDEPPPISDDDLPL
jgi:hypothetical protein